MLTPLILPELVILLIPDFICVDFGVEASVLLHMHRQVPYPGVDRAPRNRGRLAFDTLSNDIQRLERVPLVDVRVGTAAFLVHVRDVLGAISTDTVTGDDIPDSDLATCIDSQGVLPVIEHESPNETMSTFDHLVRGVAQRIRF